MVFYITPGSFLPILIFFLFAFKNVIQHLVILPINHNIDKIHTKYQDQNAVIILFYELELFCQYTFISSDRLIGKRRASRILQVILPVRYRRSQFTKALTSWNKLNGQQPSKKSVCANSLGTSRINQNVNLEALIQIC